MASLAMPAASFLGATRTPPATARHVAMKAVRVAAADESLDTKESAENRCSNTMRRDLVLAGVAAGACSLVGKMAMAEEEPKRGTPEARKKYAPVCVTMPTASICHK